MPSFSLRYGVSLPSYFGMVLPPPLCSHTVPPVLVLVRVYPGTLLLGLLLSGVFRPHILAQPFQASSEHPAPTHHVFPSGLASQLSIRDRFTFHRTVKEP